MISSPKVLVTGVAGLIGSHMAQYLIEEGYQVFGVDDLSGGYLENVPEEVRFYCGSVQNVRWVRSVFKRVKPDYVYHFAAYAAEGLSPFIRNFNYSNNLLGSINVINECVKNGVKKIIFTSSMAVYGHGKPPFREVDQPHPVDPYGIAKYAVELDLAQAYQQFGLKYSIVRPHNVIGVRQNIWDRYRNVIGIWIRQALAGEDITIFGDGEQKRAFSNVLFCLEPMRKLLNGYDGQVFNLGSDKDYTLNQAAQVLVRVGKEFGCRVKIKHLEARQEVKNAYCSHEKAAEILGFKDKTNLRETIWNMFAWATKQEERPVRKMNYEVERGMYQFWK